MRSEVANELQNYIDGSWVDAVDGERFDVFNPPTGEVLATAPHSKQADAVGRLQTVGGGPGAGQGRRRGLPGEEIDLHQPGPVTRSRTTTGMIRAVLRS